MKTRNILMTLGVAALAAMTLNAVASDALLSPRAAGNQINAVASASSDVNLATTNAATVSPRALGNQITTVASTANDVNPSAACRNMAASPKAVALCAAHPGAVMPCCAKSN